MRGEHRTRWLYTELGMYIEGVACLGSPRATMGAADWWQGRARAPGSNGHLLAASGAWELISRYRVSLSPPARAPSNGESLIFVLGVVAQHVRAS